MGVERLKLLQMKKNFIHKKVDTMQKSANQEIIVEIIQKIGAKDRFVLMFPQNSILIGKFEKK